jgi:hypothetical protein
MQFRLIYEGPLKSNRGPMDKQRIRREIHTQLKELCTRPQLQPFQCLVNAKNNRATVHELGGFTFVPLVTEKLRHVAEIDVTLFTPEEPGRTITQGGDLDNRMKTLLDSLRIPKVLDELPKADIPSEQESPFYCVLEDDNLISRLTVSADRLLRPVADRSHVLAIIQVTPKPTYSTMGEVQWVSI